MGIVSRLLIHGKVFKFNRLKGFAFLLKIYFIQFFRTVNK